MASARVNGGRGKRKPLRLPEVLTEAEQEELLRQANPRYPTGHRNKVLLRLMLDTGLRLSEAVNLIWRDVDLLTGRLMVREGKGKRDRALWVNEDMLQALRSWRQRQADLGVMKHVFTTLQGRPLSPRYVQQMVKRYAAKAGISKRVTPHTLRHSFATDLLRATGNLHVVQRSLGHADPSTTAIYLHLTDADLESALRSFRRRE